MIDLYNRTEPSRIYLARPGKMLLGCLNGVLESSANLTINLINANELSFDIYKEVDGKPSAYYDYVDILMELYVDNFGWYQINESPTVSYDGTKEYKSVTAKSLEIMMQQYDLYEFDINMATVNSREMLATDNTYKVKTSDQVEYTAFRDRVLFYRRTDDLEALQDEIDDNTSYDDFLELLKTHPNFIAQSWRIEVAIDDNLYSAFNQMLEQAETQEDIDFWTELLNTETFTSTELNQLILQYPELLETVTLKIDKTDLDDASKELTPYELTAREHKRLKELSLLDLILAEIPDWTVGYVDENVYIDGKLAKEDSSHRKLENEVGSFEVDSQDRYSFLTQEIAGYFQCIFIFDTMNCTVNAYRMETLGKDTNIFLSFRNVQNDVTVTPSQDLYTWFTVENSDKLGITYVNFGKTDIYDISYFLNTKYLKQHTIDNYKKWLDYREVMRPRYIQVSRQYYKKLQELEELKNRVPADMLNIDQLETFSDKELEALLDNYQDILNYCYSLYTIDGVFDEEGFKKSIYYDNCQLIENFNIPNIHIEQENREKYSYEDKSDFKDDFEYDFDTYGHLYGLDELIAYRDKYADVLQALKDYKDGVLWKDLNDEQRYQLEDLGVTENIFNNYSSTYKKYEDAYNSCVKALAQRQIEYDALNSESQSIFKIMKEIEQAVLIENFREYPWYFLADDKTTGQEQVNDAFLMRGTEDGDDPRDSGGTDYYLYFEEPHGEYVFTVQEISQINRLYKHTDYQNDNIVSTSVDTTDEIIDAQEKMYKAAVDELYAESHPQYSYSSTLDNLLSTNEYEDFHPDFEVANFIRLGLDDETQVKLRMLSISLNPMTNENDLSISFTNMVNYKATRNDFAKLLDNAVTSAKNSIQAIARSNPDKEDQFTVGYEFVKQILQSSAFSSYASNLTNKITNKAVNTASSNASSNFGTMFSNYLINDPTGASQIVNKLDISDAIANLSSLPENSPFANYLNTDALQSDAIISKILQSDRASFNKLVSKTVNTNTIGTVFLQATDAEIDKIRSQIVTAEDVLAKMVDADEVVIHNKLNVENSAFINYLESNLVVAEALHAKTVDTDTLRADNAFLDYLESKLIVANAINADNISTQTLVAALVQAETGDFENLTADNAFIDFLQSNLVVASEIKVDDLKAKLAQIDTLEADNAFIKYLEANLVVASEIKVDDLKAKLAQIDTLTAGSAFVQYLQSLSSTVVNQVVDKEYVKELVANYVTIADLAAGNIVLSDAMQILSENGQMVMNGTALQIMGEDEEGNPYVGVQLGYDTDSNPSLILRNAEGTTILTPTGITQDAVADGLIINNMISDRTIQKGKLGFNIVEGDENGNVSITKVLDGSGGSFGVEYTNFKNNTNQAIGNLDTKIDNSATYTLYIQAPNGTNIRGQNITLTVKLLKNSIDVTDDFDNQYFTWTRHSSDSYGDTYWNQNHSTGTKTLTLTASDITVSADFECKFEYDGLTVVSE